MNGVESFWSMLERGCRSGACRHFSGKRLQRCVDGFSGRRDTRPSDMPDRMAATVAGMAGKRLEYRDPVA